MFIFVCYKSKKFSSIGKTPKSHKWLKRSATRFMWSKIMLMWSKKLRSFVPTHAVNAHHPHQSTPIVATRHTDSLWKRAL